MIASLNAVNTLDHKYVFLFRTGVLFGSMKLLPEMGRLLPLQQQQQQQQLLITQVTK